MKKIYMTPTMFVVKINTGTQLLAGSTLGMGLGDVDPTIADAHEFDLEEEDVEDDFDMDEEGI